MITLLSDEKKKKIVVIFLLLIISNSFLLSSISYAQTSLIGIELFTNQVSTNNSNSTYQAPLIFDSISNKSNIDFTVTGQALTDVNILNGQKQVVLVIPDDLIGEVSPNGQAKIEVDVLLSEKAPVIGGLLGTISKLLKDILKILGLLLPISKQISALLDRLFNLGRLSYTADIINHGSYLSIDYETGLVSAIIHNLQGVVGELQNILKGLSGNILIGALLGSLTTAVNNLSNALANPSAELLDSLANASILSNTEVVFPTTINKPQHDIYGDINGISKKDFHMHIVQTEVIELDVFKDSNSLSSIYLKALKQESYSDMALPTNLNFGKHTIQTLNNEEWIATSTGEQEDTPTTGKISLTDTTSGGKNWQIKVKQTSNWKNQQSALQNSILKLYGGELTYTGFEDTDINYPFTNTADYLEITDQNEKVLLELNTLDRRGSLQFDIKTFKLFIPKNLKKDEGVYQAQFIWTASNGP